MEVALGDKRKRRFIAVVLAGAILSMALLFTRGAGAGVETAAAGGAGPPLDHFYCYKGTFSPDTPVGASITLDDQFSGAPAPHAVGKAKFFCNPVEKKHGEQVYEIINPANHLTAYQLDGTVPKELLHVVNQFESPTPFDPANLITNRGTASRPKQPLILVPSQKQGHPAPSGINHFKCYQAKRSRKSLDVKVRLDDQFDTPGPALVKRAKFLCNPAVKVHQKNTFPILNSQAHLVCYGVVNPRTNRSYSVTTTAQIGNQFGTRVMSVRKTSLLCVPSQKFHLLD